MSGDDFKELLRRLRRTQIAFAREIGVSRRTVHLWAERGPPAYVVYLLALLEQLESRKPDPSRPDTSGEPDPASMLDELLARATGAKAGPAFVDAVEHWLDAHRAPS